MMRDYVKKACSMAGRLLPAAALGAALLLAGSGRVDGSQINCLSSGSGCDGYYDTPGIVDNTWLFYRSNFSTIYTLQIVGTVTDPFKLNINDRPYSINDGVEQGKLGAFPGATCIPIFDQVTCSAFDIVQTYLDPIPTAPTVFSYRVTLRWFENANPDSKPDNGFLIKGPLFGNYVAGNITNPVYDPNPGTSPPPCAFGIPFEEGCFPLIDPVLGGDSDSFSSISAAFYPASAVPEPASMVLFGTGIVAVLAGRARRKNRSRKLN